MTDEPKPYGAILVDAAKRHGTAGAAGLAVALSITALATGGSESPAPTAASSSATVTPLAAEVTPTGPRKRLDITTDVEIAAGASVTASGQVELGARLVPLASCVGQYSEATRLCVLSPGPWELHSSCSEAPLAPTTTCEVVVRNTGAVPLRFSGYVEVAAP